MSSGNSDVVVHIDRPLDAGERASLEQTLRAAAGIRGLHSSDRAEQLLIVEFDPSTISALGVLRHFRAIGLNARLVGM